MSIWVDRTLTTYTAQHFAAAYSPAGELDESDPDKSSKEQAALPTIEGQVADRRLLQDRDQQPMTEE